jgi:hypothetical protein
MAKKTNTKNEKSATVRIEAHLSQSDADKLTEIANEDGRSRKNLVEFLLIDRIRRWEKERK